MTITNNITTVPTKRVERICSDVCRTANVTLYPSYIRKYKDTISSPYPFVQQNKFLGLTLYRSRGIHQLNWQNPTDIDVSYSYMIGTQAFNEDLLLYKLPEAEDESYYKALQAFYSKISNLKVNMAQVYVERQQTINLIADTAKRLSSWYRSLKRGRNPFTGTTCNGREASNLWLQYTYGWTPLISDVYSAMEALKGDVPPMKLSVSRTSKSTRDIKTVVTTYLQGNRVYNYLDLDGRCSNRTTVFSSFTIKDPALLTANHVGLTNPALLVWEVIPYSFVVDWFIPIGSWLEAQSALAGLTVREASVTRTSTFTWYGTSEAKFSGSFLLKSSSSTSIGQESKYKRRTLGLPSVPLPRFKSPCSTSHAITALALLRQAFH